MGIEDPAIWVASAGAVGTLGAAIFRLVKAKIQADSNTRIAEMAFKDTEPADRAPILDGLSKLRQFHPGAAEPTDDAPAPALTDHQLLRRRRK